MKKNKLVLAILAIVILLFSLRYKVILFSLLWNDNPLKIKTIELINMSYLLECYYLPSNATSQDYVQIRQVNKQTNAEIILENYERYQSVSNYKQLNDSLVSIILIDTSSYIQRRDTVLVKIKP